MKFELSRIRYFLKSVSVIEAQNCSVAGGATLTLIFEVGGEFLFNNSLHKIPLVLTISILFCIWKRKSYILRQMSMGRSWRKRKVINENKHT